MSFDNDDPANGDDLPKKLTFIDPGDYSANDGKIRYGIGDDAGDQPDDHSFRAKNASAFLDH